MNMRNETLGFVGLGAMGQRLARRLLSHGFKVVVFDRTRTKAEALAADGAITAPDLSELAAKSNLVMSCLSDDAAVLSAYDGPRGLMASMKPGSTVIEMSTILPETSQALNQLGQTRGVEVLDVAISGSTPAAEQGALTLLGGGDQRVFESCKPIFEVLARHYFYLGPSGSGTTMKLVVNTLLGVNMQAIAEAVAFGEKAGLDRRLLFEVLAQTAVVAPAHQGKLPRAEHRDYSPQFPLRLMNKDFRLILDKAARLYAPMPATAAAFQINVARAAKSSEEDFSSVIDEMEKSAAIDRNQTKAG